MDLKILEIQGKKMGIIVTNEKLEEIISEIIKNNGEDIYYEWYIDEGKTKHFFSLLGANFSKT